MCNFVRSVRTRLISIVFFTLLLFASASATAAIFTSIAISAQSGSVTYGTSGSVTYTVTVTATGGANNFVTCTFGAVSGLPAGVTAAFTPNPARRRGAGTATSTLTLTTNAGTTPATTNDAFTVSCARNSGGSLSINGSLTVSPRPVTVTAAAQSKNYGAPDPALTYSVTSGNLVNGDTFSGALARIAGEAPGTYQITQGTLALSSNYALSYVPANLTIVSVTSRFNAFETATAASAISGKIYTKLAGAGFGLDIVAVSTSNAQDNGFNGNVKLELLANTGTAGLGYGSDNCPSANSVIQTIASHAISSGRSTVNFSAVSTAYRDVRVRISFPTSSPTIVSCSTDSFAIRPLIFTVTSTNATNNNSTGTPAIKTGAFFNLTATAGAGYNGTPAIDNGKIIGSPNAGAIGGSFGAASAATGAASGSNFYYSEVGNFGLSAGAVYDNTFTGVDAPGADCTADFSTTLVGGKYGCNIGSSGFGRFIPDNFNVAYTAPTFSAACGSFTYAGQPFTFSTAPVITVTARNGANNGLSNATTLNYAGAYMKFANVAGTSLNLPPYDTQSGRYARFDALGGGATPALDVSGLPATTADPAIGAFANGVGTLTFSAGSGLKFVHGTVAAAPFNADIALSINIIDNDGVAYGSNPARFGTAGAGSGIAFGGGNKAVRFGRLRLTNANGSELLALPIPMQTQYWNGAVFTTNTLDNCTSLSSANIVLGNYTGGITATNMNSANVNLGGALSAGIGSLTLSKPAPTPSQKGSVNVTVNLSAEGKTYLQTGASFTSNPVARASFGVRKSGPVVFMREMY